MSGRLQVLGGREGKEGKWELSLNRCRNIPYFTCVCVVGMGWGRLQSSTAEKSYRVCQIDTVFPQGYRLWKGLCPRGGDVLQRLN